MGWLLFTLLAASVGVVVSFYWLSLVTVKAVAGTSKRIKELVSATPSILHPWHSVPWLLSSGLQTAAAIAWRRKPHLQFEREILPISDGGQVGLDWLTPVDPKLEESSPILIILHGMSGGSKETYLQHLIKVLSRTVQCRVVVMIHRGLAGVPMTSWTPYNAGKWGDIKETAIHVHKKFPRAPLIAVGYSLGASVLTHYVCEAEECLLTAAVAVSSPIDLGASSAYMSTSSTGRQMQDFMLKQLIRYATKNAEAFKKCPILDGNALVQDMQSAKDIHEYDEKGTSKIFGYPSANAYYDANSTYGLLPKAKVPLLLVNALDDPVVPPSILEKSMKSVAAQCPNVAMAVSTAGGHVAFLELKDFKLGNWLHYEHSWTDRVCTEFLHAALQTASSQ